LQWSVCESFNVQRHASPLPIQLLCNQIRNGPRNRSTIHKRTNPNKRVCAALAFRVCGGIRQPPAGRKGSDGMPYGLWSLHTKFGLLLTRFFSIICFRPFRLLFAFVHLFVVRRSQMIGQATEGLKK
jgi:hypothetical protein